MKRSIRRLIIILAVIAAVAAISAIIYRAYVSDYYRASDEAYAVLTEQYEDVTIEVMDDMIIFLPKDIKDTETGLIFYPGGKVEYEAYAPLMLKCAENGVLCVLLEMPDNLAILDHDAAEGIKDEYPDIKRWFLGGHSLGGVSACMYLSENTDDYDGIVLLGAYSSSDLSDTDLEVLLIYGSEDGVMNRKNYEKSRVNLPSDYTEYVIEGGCHSYFGDYGLQDGDGTPSITSDEQQEITASLIAGM